MSSREITTKTADLGRDLLTSRYDAHLVLMTGDSTGKTFTLTDTVTVGRSREATIRLNDRHVSRVHARIERNTTGRYTVEDLSSHNGTFVNGKRVKGRHALWFGDKIGLGPRVILMFTYRDLLQEQMLQSQKLESIGRLAGGVAHDFNNLLGVIMASVSYLDLLKQESEQTPIGGQEVTTCLEDIRSAITRASALTNQLLGFARRGRYETKPVDLSTLIDEVVRLIRRSIEYSIAIETSIPPGLWVIGDSAQLQQVVMNLCLNARDAMPSGGTLRIELSELVVPAGELISLAALASGRYVVLSVSDTGLGMDSDTAAHVFEPFFTTKRSSQGTGLGLATAYGIVRQHGGHIEVESEVGQGSCFRAFLPATDERLEQQQEQTWFVRDEASKMVLLVDDDELVRFSANRLLVQLGFEVLLAEDGVEAVEIFEKRHDDIRLVLLDWIMPKMNGAKTLEELKAIDPRVRVLLISAYIREEDPVHNLISDGSIGLLRKPFDTRDLKAALQRVL